MLESIIGTVLIGIIGYLIAEFVPIPDKAYKAGKYIVVLLLAIAGIMFGSWFGYIIYGVILEPKNTQNIFAIGGMSLFLLIMSMSSFYLSQKAWKYRNA